MARQSSLTPEQWEQVERAAIAGVPPKDICTAFPISPAALEKASQRGRWATPDRIANEQAKAAQQAKERKAEAMEQIKDSTPALSGIVREAEKRAEYIVPALTMTAEGAQERVVGSLTGLAYRSADRLDKWTPPAPKSLKDGLTLVQIAKQAARLDVGGGVQVNVGVQTWAVTSLRSASWVGQEQCVEAEVVVEDSQECENQ